MSESDGPKSGPVAAAATILVVDDNAQSRELAADVLRHAGFSVLLAANGEECLKLTRLRAPDVIVLDRMMPEMSGDEVAAAIRREEAFGNLKILMLSAKTSVEDRIVGLTLGADDYLTKPFDRRELVARVKLHVHAKQAEDALQRAYAEVERKVRERTAELTRINKQLQREIGERTRAEAALREALQQLERMKNRLQAENLYLQDELAAQYIPADIVSGNGGFEPVLRSIRQVAPTDTTVLILGETGTGKELVARAVHESSRRKDRPMVKVDCAVLPANLIESELFGHERGAFTGADARKIGRFELADGGTVFLDEIGELPLDLQVKLLRVLQEGEFERLGNPRPIRVDVRVLAATNRDLGGEVGAGNFREDLYYRLNVFPIVCPPLRERKEDVPLLAGHFLRKHAPRVGKRIERISPSALESLGSYHWPGNVRELENVIERALILCQGAELTLDEPLGGRIGTDSLAQRTATLAEMERDAILATLESCNWAIEGKTGAARRLDIPPSTLRSRMRKLDIGKPGQG